jgi:hypothetical protein
VTVNWTSSFLSNSARRGDADAKMRTGHFMPTHPTSSGRGRLSSVTPRASPRWGTALQIPGPKAEKEVGLQGFLLNQVEPL